MITPELFQQAIAKGADPCKGEEGCIHEAAMHANVKALEAEIEKCIFYAVKEGASPTMLVFSAGIHIGYRLAQLETEPASTTIN